MIFKLKFERPCWKIIALLVTTATSLSSVANELPECAPDVHVLALGALGNGEVSIGCQEMSVDAVVHLEIKKGGVVGKIVVEIPDLPRNIKRTCRDPGRAIQVSAENALRRSRFSEPAEPCMHKMIFTMKPGAK